MRSSLLEQRLGLPITGLSVSQLQIDNSLHTLTEEVNHPLSIVAMLGGGLAFRGTNLFLSRLASPLLTESAAFKRLLTQTSIRALSLGTEVATFRAISQGPSHVFAGQAFATDYLNFGILKIIGRLALGQNAILTHFLQATGMVAGHNLAYGFSLTTAPQGTLMEQLAFAEATNVKLGLAMNLLGVTAPGISALERSLDIQSTFSQTVIRLNPCSPQLTSFFSDLGSSFELRRQKMREARELLDRDTDSRPDEAPPLVSLETVRLAWKSIDSSIMLFPANERRNFLEEASLGFNDSERPDLQRLLSSSRVLQYWGDEESLREIYLYFWRERISGSSFRKSGELVAAAAARWEGQYWHAKRQIYLDTNSAKALMEDPRSQLITLYHVGNTPWVYPDRYNTGQFSASLLEAVHYGAHLDLPVWAIDIPFAQLEQVMQAINPYFYWSEKIQISRAPGINPEAYHLRQIGKSLGGLALLFEDIQKREIVLYGDLRKMKGQYLWAAKYCRKHGGLPHDMQAQVVIPSGTSWVLPESVYGMPRTDADDQANEDRWRNPFYRRFSIPHHTHFL